MDLIHLKDFFHGSYYPYAILQFDYLMISGISSAQCQTDKFGSYIFF